MCGRPLVGNCLNKKYRYYQCIGARPHENHRKTCSALYIRADALEEIVWTKTRSVLSDPGIILKELQGANDQTNLDSIDAEIKQLTKSLHIYEQRRNNLLEATEFGEFEKDEILD
jgi:site-specific DNA recombinase